MILQLYNIHHLDNDPFDDPVLIIMDLPHGDLTNDQSPSVAVHDEDVHQDISGVHQGIDPAPEAQLVPGTSLSSRREWESLSDLRKQFKKTVIEAGSLKGAHYLDVSPQDLARAARSYYGDPRFQQFAKRMVAARIE